MSFSYPVKHFSELNHIGFLENKNESCRFSLEGSGLSVSNNPGAWRQIGKGRIVGHDWIICRADEKPLSMINYHKIKNNPEFKQNVIQYGLEHDLLTLTKLYRVTVFDCEMDSEIFSDYVDYDEALAEADEDESLIESINGFLATELLCQRSKVSTIDPVSAFSFTAILYLESIDQADGIWWNDKLSPYQYSAPRGVIFPSKLKNITAVSGDLIKSFS